MFYPYYVCYHIHLRELRVDAARLRPKKPASLHYHNYGVRTGVYMAEKSASFHFRKNDRNDPNLEKELDAFRAFLKSRGHRITRERESIAEAVLLNRGHFDVDELFLHLKGRVGVSKASIYRTIPILIESGLLAAVYLENGHMHYERVYGRDHHSHLRCTTCGRIFDFSVPQLPALEKEIAEQKGFRSEGHKFEIWGQCSGCRDKQ